MLRGAMVRAAKTFVVAFTLMLVCFAVSNLTPPTAAFDSKGSNPGTAVASRQSRQVKEVTALRLPRTATPSAYELKIEPDLEKFTYRGSETITIAISAPTAKVTLNALEMNIRNVQIEGANGRPFRSTARVQMDPKNEQAHFLFNDSLPKGTYKLRIDFDAILNDQLRGFYRSYYKDPSGNKHWLCLSQMEPSDARRMFPCFDEPDFKATFQISVVISPRLSAISNSHIDHTVDNMKTGKRTVVFAVTPKMSTYLVVLVVGDFKPTGSRKACDALITVWAPSGQEMMGEYALGAACDVMQYLSSYFGTKYPMKKLDLVAVPDFAPGAMENLGAITFKDSRLLLDPRTGSSFAKRSTFNIIAHEMAHQWFGDMVTSKWWDDLWLSEAFATWMTDKTANGLHPEWRSSTKSVIGREDAKHADELRGTHPIHAPVGDPKQASEMFDAITYDKGSAVLRMLEVFIGERVFQKGVHNYLEAFKFGNASGADFWKAIGSCTRDVPVEKMMQGWINQAGYPVIIAHNKQSGKVLELTQERYLATPGEHADSSLWMIPVMVRGLAAAASDAHYGAHPDGLTGSRTGFLLDKHTSDFVLPDAWGDSTVVNAGASGFYRVLYSSAALKNLLDGFERLTPEERLTLALDVANLDWAGRVPLEDDLGLMLKVKTEKDPVVLGALVRKFELLRRYINVASLPLYEKFVRVYLRPLKESVGWEERAGEEPMIKDVRADVIRILGCGGQDDTTLKEATERFNKYLKDRQSINPDIVGTVLSIVAYNGGNREYEQVMSAWKSATNPQEEKQLISALIEFRKPELVGKTLDLTLAPEMRTTDSVRLLMSLLSNFDTNAQSLKFTREHWEQLGTKIPPRFNKMIVGSCSNFDTPEAERDLLSFFGAHPPESAKAAVSRMLEEVHVSVLYRQRNELRYPQWLSAQVNAM